MDQTIVVITHAERGIVLEEESKEIETPLSPSTTSAASALVLDESDYPARSICLSDWYVRSSTLRSV